MDKHLEFNNEKTYFSIYLFRFNEDPYPLNNDHISEVKIFNDISETMPRIELTISDTFAHLLPTFNIDGRSCIGIEFQYKEFNFVHKFIMHDIIPVEIGVEQTIYTIKGISTMMPLFSMGRIEFSTVGKQDTVTSILHKVLKQGFGDYYNKDLPTDFIHTDKKINYITPVNFTLNDSIDYLLNLASSSDSGLYFVNYNMLTNKINLLSLKTIFEKDLENNMNYNKMLTRFNECPDIDGTIFSDKWFMGDVESNNFLTPETMFKYMLEPTLTNFDQTKREWTEKTYSEKKLQQFLPKDNNLTDSETNFKKIDDSFIGTSIYDIMEEPKHNDLGQRMIDFFKYQDTVQFITSGFITRTTGETFLISVDNIEQPLHKRYAGKWLITRLHHIFNLNDKTYTQDVSMARNSKIKTTPKEFFR